MFFFLTAAAMAAVFIAGAFWGSRKGASALTSIANTIKADVAAVEARVSDLEARIKAVAAPVVAAAAQG